MSFFDTVRIAFRALLKNKMRAILTIIGVVIGIVSLVLFCHALGLNLRDQGWGSGSDSWNTNRGEVIVSFIGFGIGTVIFWLGFHQTTKPN